LQKFVRVKTESIFCLAKARNRAWSGRYDKGAPTARRQSPKMITRFFKNGLRGVPPTNYQEKNGHDISNSWRFGLS
jgi:hypothetical protein